MSLTSEEIAVTLYDSRCSFKVFAEKRIRNTVSLPQKNTSWIYPQTFICSWHPGWGVYLRHKSFLTQLWLGKCPMCLAFVPLRLCALPFDQSIEKNPSRFGLAKFYWRNYTAGLFQFHVSSSSGVKIQNHWRTVNVQAYQIPKYPRKSHPPAVGF